MSEASRPNFEPHAHARLTGLTKDRAARGRPGNVWLARRLTLPGLLRAARTSAAFCRRETLRQRLAIQPTVREPEHGRIYEAR